jgi:uncharacterized membrane protein YphA (DoxX/SURF4 family)
VSIPSIGDSLRCQSPYSAYSVHWTNLFRERRRKLQRLFSTFPGGWPGVGLLLLRAAVGLTSAIQGGIYLADWRHLTLWTCAAGLLGLSGGVALLVGFMTPVAGFFSGLGAIGSAASWLPAPSRNLFDATLPTALVVVVSAAVVFLGPGAMSVDARLFGRREIIIPRGSQSTKF